VRLVGKWVCCVVGGGGGGASLYVRMGGRQNVRSVTEGGCVFLRT